MYKVQTLRQELAISRKKLQEYADTIVSLHGELRTLRENICSTCKHKFLPGTVLSQAPSRGPVEHNLSTFSGFHQKPHISSDIQSSSETRSTIPALSTPNSIPSPLPVLNENKDILRSTIPNPLATTASSKFTTPNPKRNVLRWFVRRDATTDSRIDVAFECAFNHKDPVQSVRFSADGKHLAVALKDSKWNNNGTIIIYDVESGKKACELVEYASQYSSKTRPGTHCACFSPDGGYLVVGDTAGHVTVRFDCWILGASSLSTLSLQVWDLSKKRICKLFRGHDGSVRSADFSPNGRLIVSASLDETVRIWNTRDGSAKVLSDNAHGFWSVRFSPNGQYVAAGNSDWMLRIWDIRTGRLVKRWTGHKGTIWSVAFTPDGRGLVTGGGDGVVKCWDVRSLGAGQPCEEPVATKILECQDQSNSIYSVAVSPDARWVASNLSNERSIICDTDSGTAHCTLIGHGDAVSSVDFSPVGGNLALGSHDCHVTLWRYTGT